MKKLCIHDANGSNIRKVTMFDEMFDRFEPALTLRNCEKHSAFLLTKI